MQLNAFGKRGAPNSKGGPKGGCFNCGGPHYAKDCPLPPKGGGKKGGKDGKAPKKATTPTGDTPPEGRKLCPWGAKCTAVKKNGTCTDWHPK